VEDGRVVAPAADEAETIVEIDYAPRKWAKRIHNSTKRWIVAVLHRRAGKTTCILNHHQRAALDDDWEYQRIKSLMPQLTDREIAPLLKNRYYGHIMPTRVQAKIVAWDMLKNYAAGTGATFNEAELLVRYPNGSRFQLFGADNPDSLRGPGFSGLSFDEYSQQPPSIFSEVLSKALADHLGYAIFAGTVKGQDHLWRTYDEAKNAEEWETIWQDIDESIATEAGPTVRLLERAMEDDRKLIEKGIMTQDEFDQEWYLSTDAAIKGAYYLKELSTARAAGRITRVPVEPLLPVDTDWDIGGDATAIWFSQSLRSGEVRIVDFYQNSGEGLPFYMKILQERGYTYGTHTGPHDIKVKEFASGKTRVQTAASLGMKFKAAPKLSLDEGIAAVRLFLSKCWFDEEKTKLGLESLRHYRKTWNRKNNEFTDTPVHDIYSHGADALRTLAVRHQPPKEAPKKQDPMTAVGVVRQSQGNRWMEA
jgi:phage terminase large subunit